jgi:hypothetical protein
MKKIFSLLFITLLLNGCAESIALLGTTAGGSSSGKMLQSSLHSTLSYGIKQQTGKSPLGHIMSYSEKNNYKKKQENCLVFIEKTNTKFCKIEVKKNSLTQKKVENKKTYDNPIKELALSVQPAIDSKFKIKYLD